nr:PhnD/SsuA/transferrin family substrate-binding protein [uncultured Desulfobacter sp.]
MSLLAFCFLLGAANIYAQDPTDEAVQDAEIVRFGFIDTIMGNVNENDVKVAVGVWIKSLTKEMSLPVEAVISIYSAMSEVESNLAKNRVDVVYITTSQLFEVYDLLAEDALLAVQQSGTITEEYILLVPEDSPAGNVGDLKGKNLRVLDNARTCLSLHWLNVFLSEKGLGTLDSHFKSYKLVNKINDAVLPVFFKQADACLVTRKGFDVMVELNPQIARQMKIIKTSPSYIPAVFTFRKSYQSEIKQILLRDIQKMVESSSGEQLLTIFQMDGMQQISEADLADSILLMKKDQGTGH